MKSLIPLFLLILLFSCSNDDETNTDRVLPTPIIEFVAESNNVSHQSDGSSYQDQVTVRLANSEVYYFNESIEFTLRVDEQNSTAIEGVDFNFTPSLYTFNDFNNFTQHIDIEILTEEVYISETKEIVFIAQEVVSNTEVSGIYTINYECFVDLTGTYFVTNDFCLNNNFSTFTATITKVDNNKWYLSSADGMFMASCTGSLGLYNFGYIEIINCSEVPFSDDLEFAPTADIGTVLGGTWDQQTGVLEMQHRDTFFNGGPYFWTSRYVRQ